MKIWKVEYDKSYNYGQRMGPSYQRSLIGHVLTEGDSLQAVRDAVVSSLSTQERLVRLGECHYLGESLNFATTEKTATAKAVVVNDD